MRQGQVSLEYMAIIGLALLISTPLMIEVQDSSRELQNSFDNALVQNALDSIEEGASLVHTQGPPAKTTFDVRLPEGIEATNVTDKYVLIERRVSGATSDFFVGFDFNVDGSIPSNAGVHTIKAEAEQGYVNISVQ